MTVPTYFPNALIWIVINLRENCDIWRRVYPKPLVPTVVQLPLWLVTYKSLVEICPIILALKLLPIMKDFEKQLEYNYFSEMKLFRKINHRTASNRFIGSAIMSAVKWWTNTSKVSILLLRLRKVILLWAVKILTRFVL